MHLTVAHNGIREETTDDEGGHTFNDRTTPHLNPRPVLFRIISLHHRQYTRQVRRVANVEARCSLRPSAVDAPPKMYHSKCFKCNVCKGTFKENGAGQAKFFGDDKGACHPEVISAIFTVLLLTESDHNQCAPPEKIKIRQILISRATAIPSSKLSPASTCVPLRKSTAPATSSPSPSTAPTTTTSFPRFGNMSRV
jgi:hypothetical protein